MEVAPRRPLGRCQVALRLLALALRPLFVARPSAVVSAVVSQVRQEVEQCIRTMVSQGPPPWVITMQQFQPALLGRGCFKRPTLGECANFVRNEPYGVGRFRSTVFVPVLGPGARARDNMWSFVRRWKNLADDIRTCEGKRIWASRTIRRRSSAASSCMFLVGA